jgi:cytochrome c biogenesis protein CcdA
METDQLDISQLGPFFGLALIDSLNPSAIAVTVLLIAQPHFPARVAAYLLGVFVTYLTLGVAGVLGLSALWSQLNTVAGHAIALALGVALLGYALFAPNRPVRESLSGVEPREFRRLGAIFLLGVTVTLAEISTALPYLAAIGILADAQPGPATWAPLLAAYNLVFIAPPLLLAFTALVMGRLAQPVLDRFGAFIRNGARETMLWLFGIAGFYLSAISAGLLAAELGLLEPPSG